MRAAMLLEPLPSTFACFFTPKVPLFCVKNSKRSGTFCYLLLKTKRSLLPFTVIHTKKVESRKGPLLWPSLGWRASDGLEPREGQGGGAQRRNRPRTAGRRPWADAGQDHAHRCLRLGPHCFKARRQAGKYHFTRYSTRTRGHDRLKLFFDASRSPGHPSLHATHIESFIPHARVHPSSRATRLPT